MNLFGSAPLFVLPEYRLKAHARAGDAGDTVDCLLSHTVRILIVRTESMRPSRYAGKVQPEGS